VESLGAELAEARSGERRAQLMCEAMGERLEELELMLAQREGAAVRGPSPSPSPQRQQQQRQLRRWQQWPQQQQQQWPQQQQRRRQPPPPPQQKSPEQHYRAGHLSRYLYSSPVAAAQTQWHPAARRVPAPAGGATTSARRNGTPSPAKRPFR